MLINNNKEVSIEKELSKEIKIEAKATLNGITYDLNSNFLRSEKQTERGYYIDTLNEPNAPYWYIICSGKRDTSGYSIEVSQIDIDENQNCKVIVRETSPEKDTVVFQEINYPSCVIELSKEPVTISIKNEQGDEFKYIQ